MIGGPPAIPRRRQPARLMAAINKTLDQVVQEVTSLIGRGGCRGSGGDGVVWK